MATINKDTDLTMVIYEGFAHDQLDRWDAIIHPDVVTNSPAGRDIIGRDALKTWFKHFITSFKPKIDLIDRYLTDERGLVTVNLHWKHDGDTFFGIAPTGTSGTSVENFLLRIENGLVTRFDVADSSLDLARYFHDQGMDLPRLVTPPVLIAG